CRRSASRNSTASGRTCVTIIVAGGAALPSIGNRRLRPTKKRRRAESMLIKSCSFFEAARRWEVGRALPNNTTETSEVYHPWPSLETPDSLLRQRRPDKRILGHDGDDLALQDCFL